MCGIVGFNWSDKEKIKVLNDLIQHRGPDDEGFYVDDKVSLGHRRLSIIDLSDAGHQPMFYHPELGASSEKHLSKQISQSHLTLIFNGEIYNYQEIKTELQKKGYHFSTNGDTEVILASYLEWGKECLNRFNGMFVLCIYDKEKQTFFMARDRIGIKPLFYFHQNDQFVFGSELKLILESGVEKVINRAALNHYLIFNFCPPKESILQNVKKLLPGEYLIYDLKENQIQEKAKYWKTQFETKITDANEAIEKIKKTLNKAVERRLIADVPVGAFLSGGVDSSIIVALMRDKVQDLKTFSIGFDYEDFNESKWAKIISDKFETDHYEIKFSDKQVLDLIEQLPNHFDEPFADASMIPTYLVSKVASEQVTVCLSGTGGDELFAGYTRHQEALKLNKLYSLPNFFKNAIAKIYGLKNKDKGKKLAQLLKSKSESELYLKLFSHLFRDEKEIDLEAINYQDYFQETEKLSNYLNFDQNIYLDADLLVKEDRATMANSLEGRVPFLDHELIELANTIHPNLKIQGKEGKAILKHAYEDLIPKEILYRKKQGFGVPLPHYFKNELKDFASNAIFDFNGFEYYDKQIIENLWQKHQSGNSNYAPLFWNLMMFNRWFEKWI